MPGHTQVIVRIHSRMIELIESLTDNPELRAAGRLLAKEFTLVKMEEGLEHDAEHVDIEASARLILKRQMLWLHEHRDGFTPEERVWLEQLAKLISRL